MLKIKCVSLIIFHMNWYAISEYMVEKFLFNRFSLKHVWNSLKSLICLKFLKCEINFKRFPPFPLNYVFNLKFEADFNNFNIDWRRFSDSFPNLFCLDTNCDFGLVDALKLFNFSNLEKIIFGHFSKGFLTAFSSVIVRPIQVVNSG